MILLMLATVDFAVAQDAVPEACLSGRPADRIAACAKVIDAQPKPGADIVARALAARCEARRFARDLDWAIADCSEAIKLDPRNEFAFFNRGFAYRLQNRADPAISDFTQVIALGPGPRVADSFVHRANGFQMKGDWNACLADVEEGLKIKPNENWYLNARAYCLANKGDYAGASRDYDAIIASAPQFIGAYIDRARMNVNRGDFAKALVDLDKAVRIAPAQSGGYFYRALAYEKQNDIPRAVADIDAARERSPDDPRIRTASERIHARAEGRAVPEPAQSKGGVQPAAAPAPPTAHEPQNDAAKSVASTNGNRVALVVGNSAYKFASPLPNPANDATDMADALRKLGFTVIEGHDLDWRGMIALVKQFAAQLQSADLALFFYAGHGIQVNGDNYLIPVDAQLETPGNLDLDAVDLRSILRPMEDRNRVNLVFLDACRDNPFTRSLAKSRGAGTRSVSVSQGLAQVQAAAGTMIAYSTQPDAVAQDGRGRNSPFTTALLKYLPRQGLEVEQMMKLVRVDVMGATQQQQVPWGHSSLVGDVFLAQQKR
ncbi:MAG: caspase family protein [Beijerinckiaceae bacterium]